MTATAPRPLQPISKSGRLLLRQVGYPYLIGMASVLLRVPVEIWHRILSNLIQPPLAPTASVSEHIHNAKTRERERGNLRLVCKAWKEYTDDELCWVDVSWTIRLLGTEPPMPLRYAQRARFLTCHEDIFWGPRAAELLPALRDLVAGFTRMKVLSLAV